MNTPDIEILLRAAPQPTPPSDLAVRLLAQARPTPEINRLIKARRSAGSTGWRWWSPWFLVGSPKVLVCPSHPNRPPAADWGSFSLVNLSYEYLASDGIDCAQDPQRVLTRCRVHGHVGLCDGSVQMVGTNSASRFETREGKLYFKIDLVRLPEN